MADNFLNFFKKRCLIWLYSKWKVKKLIKLSKKLLEEKIFCETVI